LVEGGYMLILNVIVLCLFSGVIGWAIGKDKIQIVREQKLTPEQEAELLKQMKEQKEAIEKYNEMARELQTYDGFEEV